MRCRSGSSPWVIEGRKSGRISGMRRKAEASVTVEHVMGFEVGSRRWKAGLTFKLSLNSVLPGAERREGNENRRRTMRKLSVFQ